MWYRHPGCWWSLTPLQVLAKSPVTPVWLKAGGNGWEQTGRGRSCHPPGQSHQLEEEQLVTAGSWDALGRQR